MTVTTADAVGTAARQRLLAGLVASIKEKGYRDTTVADIVRHARTSRRTFYAVFATKDDCFLALVQEMNLGLRDLILATVDPDADWDDQVRAAMSTYVRSLAAEPELARSWIRELPGLGPAADAVQRDGEETLVHLLVALAATPGMRRAGVRVADRSTAVFILGGLRELVARVVEEGGDLDAIEEPAVRAILALLAPPSTGGR